MHLKEKWRSRPHRKWGPVHCALDSAHPLGLGFRVQGFTLALLSACSTPAALTSVTVDLLTGAPHPPPPSPACTSPGLRPRPLLPATAPGVSQGTFMPTSPQQTCHLSLPQLISHCCSAHLISTPKESPHPGTFPISPSMMSSASPSTWAQQPPPRPCPICSCSLPFTPCSSSPHLCLPSLKSSVTPSSQAYQTHAGPRAHWLGPPDGPDLPATPPRDLLMFPQCSYSRGSEKTLLTLPRMPALPFLADSYWQPSALDSAFGLGRGGPPASLSFLSALPLPAQSLAHLPFRWPCSVAWD